MENKWYKVDDRWSVFDINSFEYYLKKKVVYPCFHPNVPEDVIKAYETVEYLLVHAWNYWQFYDEAYNKVLRVFEIAVKQKAIQENISLKNDKKDKSLHNIINEIYQNAPNYLENLKFSLQNIRKLRNTQMHPDRNSFRGIVGNTQKLIKLVINLINQIFMPEEWHKVNYELAQQINPKLENTKDSLFVLEYNKPSILIDEIIHCTPIDNILFVACNPVITNVLEAISSRKYNTPVILTITDCEISDDSIKGKSIDGHSINIYKTTKPENLLIHKKYKDEISMQKVEDILIYKRFLAEEAFWKLIDAEYDYNYKLYSYNSTDKSIDKI